MGTERPDVDGLVARLNAASDEPTKEAARELVKGLLELHAAGLKRVLELLKRSGDAGRATLEAMADDSAVGSMLVLHDLHPQSVETRARDAVTRLQGAYPDLELVSVADGIVRVRIASRAGVGVSRARAVEASLVEAVPDALAIDVQLAVAPELLQLRRKDAEP